jgi:hypothetical protein
MTIYKNGCGPHGTCEKCEQSPCCCKDELIDFLPYSCDYIEENFTTPVIGFDPGTCLPRIYDAADLTVQTTVFTEEPIQGDGSAQNPLDLARQGAELYANDELVWDTDQNQWVPKTEVIPNGFNWISLDTGVAPTGGSGIVTLSPRAWIMRDSNTVSLKGSFYLDANNLNSSGNDAVNVPIATLPYFTFNQTTEDLRSNFTVEALYNELDAETGTGNEQGTPYDSGTKLLATKEIPLHVYDLLPNSTQPPGNMLVNASGVNATLQVRMHTLSNNLDSPDLLPVNTVQLYMFINNLVGGDGTGTGPFYACFFTGTFLSINQA